MPAGSVPAGPDPARRRASDRPGGRICLQILDLANREHLELIAPQVQSQQPWSGGEDGGVRGVRGI